MEEREGVNFFVSYKTHKQERRRYVLERRGMRVSCDEIEYMCENEREVSGMVRLQGIEDEEVYEFKYLGLTVQSNGSVVKR